MFLNTALFLYDNFMEHLMRCFIILNLFNAVFMLCNSAFEQGSVDLRRHITAFMLVLWPLYVCVIFHNVTD